MRFLFLLLLLVFTTTTAHSQNERSKEFLRNFFRDSMKLVYSDKLGEYETERMEKTLAKDTLYDVFDAKRHDSTNYLILTEQEHSYIQSELVVQHLVIWPEHLFDNGVRVTQATLDSLYKDHTRDWRYIDEHYGPRLYRFSNPIFIRNYSLCIFYSGYTCGSRCGEGRLIIYRKKTDTWIPWIELYRWVS